MGLFKKKAKVAYKSSDIVPDRNTKSNTEEKVEILDLDETSSETKEVAITSETDKNKELETKKENRNIIIIVVVIVLFALLLPTLTKVFKKTSTYTYNNEQKEIEENKTVDGMIEIDKEEGYIIAKKIKFYNIRKKTDNIISIIYLPQTTIKDVNEKNIYIELYNSKKDVIYRTKFISDTNLERKIQGTYELKLNPNIYKEATYGKIVIFKENEWGTATDTLTCTNNFKDSSYELSYKVVYGFGPHGLLNYNVSKEVKINMEEELKNNPGQTEEAIKTRLDKYKEIFRNEGDEISKTNITNLFFDDETIEYKVDLQTIELNNSDYKLLYEIGSTKRQIKLTEESNNWSCK